MTKYKKKKKTETLTMYNKIYIGNVESRYIAS